VARVLLHPRSRVRRSLLLVSLIVLLIVSTRQSNVRAEGEAFLVKDINPTGESSPGHFVLVGSRLFFKADDGVVGRELWQSDGTAAGTTLVADINQGSNSSFRSDIGMPATALNDLLLFAADDGVHGVELWKSDGSGAGTSMIMDIFPGRESSYPESFTVVAGTLYFVAENDMTGRELWKTDGTPSGTMLVKDIHAGNERRPFGYPDGLTNFNGMLFFTAEGRDQGDELWKSDGTLEGTVPITTIGTPGSIVPYGFTVAGQSLFFAYAKTGVGELWKTDGTAEGTSPVTTSSPGARFEWPTSLSAVGDTLYFGGRPTTPYDVGTALWRTDGTAEGTIKLTTGNVAPSEVKRATHGLLFKGNDHDHGSELWRTDGTPGGTGLLRDIWPGQGSALGANYFTLTSIGEIVFFSPDDGVHGAELWKSDGTAQGTVLVDDIAPGARSSNPYNFTLSGRNIFFSADDGLSGRELWAVPFSIQLDERVFLPMIQR
jgi:ELWxxDGT repeat protein